MLYVDTTVHCYGPNGAATEESPPGAGWRTISISQKCWAAHNKDGTIASGNAINGLHCDGAPTGQYMAIYEGNSHFAALSITGTIAMWAGGSSATCSHPCGSQPTRAGYTALRAGGGGAHTSWCALWSDGTINCWGLAGDIGEGRGVGYPWGERPWDGGYVSLFANQYAWVALKADGTARSFGRAGYGGDMKPLTSSPTEPLTNVARIFGNTGAFVAMFTDGTLACWGAEAQGGAHPSLLGRPQSGCPSGTFSNVWSNYYGFVALRTDGALAVWGRMYMNGGCDPSYLFEADVGNPYVLVRTTRSNGFVAQRSDGTIIVIGRFASTGCAMLDITGSAASTSFNGAAMVRMDDSWASEPGWDLCSNPAHFSNHVRTPEGGDLPTRPNPLAHYHCLSSCHDCLPPNRLLASSLSRDVSSYRVPLVRTE